MMKFVTAATNMLLLGVMLMLAGSAIAQQAYPSKPIRFITPYAPGGSTSIMARVIGQKLTEAWGQPVVVDNRPGGNTIIGTDALAKSAPDGYTIMLTTNTHVINPNFSLNLPYDTIKDFTPVATLYISEFVLVLNSSVPANSLQELIALAKSKPGKLNYASTGSAGSSHLAAELFNVQAGVNIQHIPYKGAGPALTDLIGGQVEMHVNNPLVMIPHIKSGKIKGIAVTGATRLAALPDVPTFAEAGLSGLDVKFWYGVLAPAGTPKAIIDKLSNEIAKILAMPDIRERLISQGLEPFISTPEQFAALMKADMAKYANLVKAANIKFDN